MYKLKSLANPFTDDILEIVCKNRGVEKEKILNYSIRDVIHHSKLKNIDKAVQLFKKLSKRESSEIGIIVDSDVDTRRIHFCNHTYSLFRK